MMRFIAEICLASAMAVPAGAQVLVTCEWLEKNRADPQLVILDARPEAEYAKGHLPGAVPINTYDHLVDSSPAGEQAFHRWLGETLGRAGLTPEDRVVIYENKLGMRAGRAYWMLYYAGLEKIAMLAGGLESWQASGLPVSTESAARPPSKFRLRPQKKFVATAQEVAAAARNPKTVILDVRTREEYEGKSGSADCARQGRIPGAVWVEWTEFLADQTAFQAPEKLGVLLMQKGITPDKQIVTYCHRGARAGMVWAALDALGFPKVKNYAGSWHDWAARKELPTE